MKFIIKFFVVALAFLTVQTSFAQMGEKMHAKEATFIEDVQVIKLAQIPGEYETKTLDLAPGKYIFEVENKNVAKKLGFYLTPTSNAKAQVNNSGLSHLVDEGEIARTGVVELTAGNYQYSCPLNPTPHYSLSVAEKSEAVTVVQLSQIPGEYEVKNLDLKPGKYIFEVNNKNVDKKLGFYLTPKSDAKAQVANSGLSHLVNKGEVARTGVVDLTTGDYQYSCPLNPTPHYSITVSDK